MTAKPRRFVHVFATFGAGGPQVRAVQLMQQLGAGHQHFVMAMNGCIEALAMLASDLDVTIVAPPPKAGFLATRRRQRAWLSVLQPDLVLTYNWGAIETVAAARSLGLPIVHHEDGFGPDEAKRRLRRRSWLRRLVLRGVPVIVPSSVLQRIAVTEWRLRAEWVHHLPNGVDLSRFHPRRSDERFDETLVAGTVGGLRAEKDHRTLLQALARLDGVRGLIVGGGALEAALRNEAAALRLGARVEFAGPVHDSAPSYRRMDVFVLSSRTEQMPIALLEAMASGLPVVATDVGDVRVMLPEGAGPFVVAAGDPAALANALQRLVKDAQLRSQLGADNRRVAEQRYELSSCLRRFLAVYARTARKAPPA